MVKRKCEHALGLAHYCEHTKYIIDGFKIRDYYKNPKVLKNCFESFTYCPWCAEKVELEFTIEEGEYCELLKCHYYTGTITNKRRTEI